MPPLTDAEILAKFRIAFEEANSGGVRWKPVPSEWIRKALTGFTIQAINDLLLRHIISGERIKQVKESREDWLHDEYHYDFILTLRGGRKIYVETTMCDTKNGPIVTVVSVHDHLN
jgi:hypothetical protein